MSVSARHILVRTIIAAAAFGAAAFGFAMLPAHADVPASCNCHAPPPPPDCNCRTNVVVAPPSVAVPNIVIVNAGARAQAEAQASASASATGAALAEAPIANIHYNSIVQGGGASITSSAMSVTQTSTEMRSSMGDHQALFQAICLDDTNNPHPASQTFGDKNVPNDYAGEIFRCMSGTRLMRVSSEGQTFDCAAGQALWYERGQVACKTQIERRPCNERSLLRRFGPGDKMVRLHGPAHAERRETQFTGALTMDGGVGAGTY
jgi:hypothetical protein